MRNISEIIDGKRKIVKKPELLAPAGNLEKLKTAIMYGADAVFVGGKEFSLRSQASNFTIDDIKEAVEFANQYGAHIHVTCNIILHQDNLEGIEEYLKKLDEILELQKSKDNKSQKWNKAKKILEFLLDKGADIAIMYIPQILSAIV